jgi:aryl sulfotransferase
MLVRPAERVYRTWIIDSRRWDHYRPRPKDIVIATWWDERHRPNVLLVHYNDLQADLSGEMRRVADFLGISVPPDIWPELVQSAGFEAMRQDGEVLMGSVSTIFQDGAARFFHRGRHSRWRGVFREEDLALYDAKVEAELSPTCARWVAHGRSRPTVAR